MADSMLKKIGKTGKFGFEPIADKFILGVKIGLHCILPERVQSLHIKLKT